MALADKARNLFYFYLGNGVRCDYIVFMALASSTGVLDSLVFGNYVSLGANFSCKTQARSFY